MKTNYTFLFSFVIALLFSTANAQTIENFTLKNADGTNVSLRSYAGKKAVVVIFTGNHCVYSKKYLDRIIALEQQSAAEGVQFILINSNDENLSPQESSANMKALVDSKGIKFPYLKDGDKSVMKRFGAKKNPDAFVLKPAGASFTVAYHGLIDDNALMPDRVKEKYLEAAIKAVVSGGTVGNAKTDAVGCTIK